MIMYRRHDSVFLLSGPDDGFAQKRLLRLYSYLDDVTSLAYSFDPFYELGFTILMTKRLRT